MHRARRLYHSETDMVMSTSRHAWLDASHLSLEADIISVDHIWQVINTFSSLKSCGSAMNAKKERFRARRPFHLPSRHPQ